MSAPGAKIAIFSDLHLPNRPDERNAAFEAALRGFAASGVTDLWLLGDIFDLLTGPYEFWKTFHPGIFDALTGLARRGCKILWLEGNHDFHLEKILRPLGIDLRDGEVPLEVGQMKRRVYLAHGDLVNPNDLAYLKWRGFTRDPSFRALLTFLPEVFARYVILPIAEYRSRSSRRQKRDTRDEIKSLYRDFADQRFKDGYTAVFIGHCHVEDFYQRDDASFYLNVGSWTEGSTRYALWEPDLEAFPKVVSCQIIKG